MARVSYRIAQLSLDTPAYNFPGIGRIRKNTRAAIIPCQLKGLKLKEFGDRNNNKDPTTLKMLSEGSQQTLTLS